VDEKKVKKLGLDVVPLKKKKDVKQKRVKEA